MSDESWQIALQRFSDFGARPSVAAYLAMFDPEGSVLHPGMSRPLCGPAIETFIAAALAAVPDFRLTPVRWAGHKDTVFVEARNSGTVSGRLSEWPSVYRLITRGGRILAGQAFYDRAAAMTGGASADTIFASG